MLTVELSSHHLHRTVRHAHVAEAVRLLRSAGLLVRPTRAAYDDVWPGLTVEADGRASVTVECIRSEAGAWVWQRRLPAWQCPADRLDLLLDYVQPTPASAETGGPNDG